MARAKKTVARPTGGNPELLALMHQRAKVLGKKFDMAPVTLSRGGYINGAVSFGAIAIDLITGGGIPPGRMTTISGPSMSGKSTLLYQASVNAMHDYIPTLYMDHESSADAKYLTALGVDLEQAADDGLLFYHIPVTGEDTYRYLHGMLEIMPDKNTTEFAPPQAIICIDSFAAMIPEAVDDNPEAKGQMAAIAKIHAWGLPLIKAKLHKKNVALVGTNQLRKKPGVVYGNPEYEPGGEALTFYADLKLQVRGKGKPELERGRSLRQSNVTSSKNKQFPPWMKIEDEHKLQIAFGYGFDRFYDGLAYLKLTGQIEFVKGKGGGWQINGFDHYAPLANKRVPTEDLVVEMFKNEFRTAAAAQMRDGSAFERLFEHLNWGKMYVYDPENSGVGEEGVPPDDVDEEEMQAAADAVRKVRVGMPADLINSLE